MISALSGRPAAWLLTALGHKITVHDNFEGATQGDGESIMIDPASGHRIGAADPRKPDARAVGY